MSISFPTGRVALSSFSALLFALVAVHDAAAWGPRARQSIALAALQLTRQKAPDAFTAGDINYEADLMRGAQDGISALGDEVPLNNDEQAIDAVYAQIQVLREARMNGAGSHFAYRMGGLAALVSELMQPYGLTFTESDMVLGDRIESDLEDHLDSFRFNPRQEKYHYIQNARLYFGNLRSFYQADKQMIADDYARGRGYYGLLSDAGAKYFERAVHAATDVWYTVLHTEGSPSDARASTRQMAFYYIDEVQYLLTVRKNMTYAERAYDLFQRYNPGLPMAYIQIGDLFYQYGSDLASSAPEDDTATQKRADAARERGVEEWKKAQRIPGEPRDAASMRLAKHYIEVGERLYNRAQTPNGLETDLPDALKAFSTALEYDLDNDVAARRITETTVAINDRRDKYELQQKFIENALKAIKVAERATLNKNYSAAIDSYNQARMLVEQVTPDFKDLSANAKDVASRIRKDTKSVIADVFASANDSIEKGENAMLNGNIDEAIRYYSLVESILDAVPAEEGDINYQRKQEIIRTAQQHIDEAEIQRERQQNRPAAPAAPAAASILGNKNT